MRKTMVLALIGILTGNTMALADTPGADWMSMDQVKRKLLSAGYTAVTRIEADDGHWEGEGVKAGRKMQFHADPKTGAIMSEKPND